MNKQEFQQKIKNMESPKNFTFISAQDAYERGFEEARGTALFNSCFLDEPEKPVVPQFVADWYEENKDDFEYNLYRLCIDFYERKLHEDLHEWFDNDKNKPIEVLVLMNKYGYEVKKEKLYSARFKLLDDVEECYINQLINNKRLFLGNLDENDYVKVFFTREELKDLGLWENVLIDTDEVEDD